MPHKAYNHGKRFSLPRRRGGGEWGREGSSWWSHPGQPRFQMGFLGRGHQGLIRHQVLVETLNSPTQSHQQQPQGHHGPPTAAQEPVRGRS